MRGVGRALGGDERVRRHYGRPKLRKLRFRMTGNKLSPHMLHRWRGEWRAKGELAFPGIGGRGADLPALDDARRIAELERKIGQLTMENDFLKKALQHFKDHHPPAVVSGGDACLKKSSKPLRKAKP